MNRNRHRVVFNAARGLRVVVAECARSVGPGCSGGGFLASALLMALPMALAVPAAHAQILTDRNAPGHQRPTVLSTANGVPLINIQTPSAGGVSLNRYSQFDIGPQGAILNNSRKGANTHIGGAVPGNPWLGSRPASVIVNQVNSSNPSHLRGPLEVAGQRAEVIVANPSGIQVNGGRFINALGVTLTTGVPVIHNGNLESFRVTQGSVNIGGLGLDLRGADHARILARAMELNAALWADHLTVLTGSNEVKALASGEDALATATPIAGTGPAPNVLLDVAAIGGMYANHIFMRGTDKGLGVNMGGTLAARQKMELLADGRLVVKGSVQSNGELSVKTADLHNQGSLQSDGNLSVAADVVTNAEGAQVVAQGNLSIQTPGELNNAGLIDGVDVSVQAHVVHNSGRLYGDQLAISAERVSNAENAVIAARERLDIQAKDTIGNQRGALILSAGDMALSADRIENRSARIEALGDLDIDARSLLNANDHLQTEVIRDGGATTTRTLYFTPSGEIDASEVAWMAVKPVPPLWSGASAEDRSEYVLHQRPWVLSRASAEALGVADPQFSTWYHGPEPFVPAGMVPVGSGDSQDFVWADAQFSYTRDDPIWAALGVAPPAGDAPGPMPRPPATDSEGAGTSGVDPLYEKALTEWQAQAAPWVALGQKLGEVRRAINAELLPFDIYQSVTETRPTLRTLHSEPAQILAGGNARLNVREQLINQDSEVIAGGALQALGVAASNQATQVQADITRTGTAHTWGVVGRDCDFISGCEPVYGWVPSAIDQRIPTTLNVTALRHESGASDAPSVSSGPSVNLGSALFQPVADPAAGFLFQSDPNFTQNLTGQRRWTDAGAQLALLHLDPNTLHKRLGDGLLEQRLVREQIARLTGQRFLGDYSDDDAQYLALLQAGATFAQAHQLRPGIALTPEQVATLTSDIVWLEAQEVTLPDGTTQTALVPRVYLKPREGDLAPSGALIAGREVHLDLSGEFLNGGSVAGRELVLIDAKGIRSSGRIASEGTTALRAKQDIDVRGGEVAARDALLLDAGRDIKVASTSAQSTDGQAVVLDRVARLHVSDEAGVLIASAGQDIELLAAGIQAGVVDIHAERDLRLTTLNTREALDATRDAKNHGRVQRSAEVGSAIGGNEVNLSAGRDVQMRAAQVQANGDLNNAGLNGNESLSSEAPYYEQDNNGRLNIHAGRHLDITAGEASYQVEHGLYAKSSDALGSSSTETRSLDSHTRAQGSALGGREVNLSAGEDITFKGSHAIADDKLDVQAGGDVRILSERTEHRQERFHEKKSSGVFGSGAGVTLGSQQKSSERELSGSGAQGSTLGALKGNVTVRAAGTYEQVGSDVLAPEGDIDVRAKDIRVTEARTTEERWQEDKMRQGGLTLGVGGGVVQAMQGTAETLEAIGKTDDQRMQALGAATAGLQIKQGLDTAGKAAASGNLADAGISVNISVGSSSSRSTSEATSDSAQGSRVSAGGNVSFIAEGAGEDSDILVRGSEVNAGKTARMKAEGDVDLRAAENTTKEKTESRNRSGSVGVGFQLGGGGGGGGAGFGITASASAGKGNAESESLSYTNTHVTAGEKVIIESGGDTTLAGAVVSANRVEADIGGKLLIESLQDTATYREKSKQAGASATFGPGAGGSFSASSTNIDSEYASVSEQSGIRAGDGGFDVRVKGHTALVGGLIASSEPAERHGRNDFSTATLSHTDLHNSAHASATSEGVNLSSDMLTQGKYGVAKGAVINGLNTGSEAGSSSGQTLATIGEARITITDEVGQVARTGQTAEQTVASLHRDAETAHTAAIEQDRVALLKEAQAQQAIKAAAVRQVVVHTDAAYDALFVKDVKFYRVSCGTVPEDCVKDPGKVVLQEVSREEAKRDGKVLAVNGILNEKERAGQLAYQNAPLIQDGDKSVKPEVIHLMHIQPADTSTGEVLAAGYEKKLAPVLGYSNADNAYADAIEGRGQEATLSLGHSRGTIVQNNAFNILADRGHVNEKLEVLGVGGAVGVDEYASSAAQVNQQPRKVEYVYMRNDPVSVIAAGNSGDAMAAFKEFWNVLQSDNSAHSCYGTGAAGCKTIANPVAGGPVPTNQQSSNVMTYRGGKLVSPAESKP